jgi:flagellum-specific ATP synthase
MPEVVTREHQQVAGHVKEMLAAFQEMEDLINIGAYRSGSNPRVDRAIALMEPIKSFLQQDVSEKIAWDTALAGLLELISM